MGGRMFSWVSDLHSACLFSCSTAATIPFLRKGRRHSGFALRLSGKYSVTLSTRRIILIHSHSSL